MTAPVEVVIVGGGASGALVAARVLDASIARPMRVRVIEGSGRLAEGVAYGTEDLDHLLNVRAGGMSADPSYPDAFAKWATAKGLGDADTFVPRRHYRTYLQDHVRAAAEGATDATFDLVADRAVGIAPAGGRIEVVVASGTRVRADRVVLAVGNAAPGTPPPLRPLAGHPRFVSDPWAPGALDQAQRGAAVLLVGAGLTMIDIAITLARGVDSYPGPTMSALSRHGLLPQVHLPARPQHDLDIIDLERDPTDLLGLVQRMRTSAATVENGDDWRDVVDSVRPYVNAVWQRAGAADQRAFLVHLSRFWDVHRHRMSPPTGARLQALIADGRLSTHRGRIVRAEVDGPAVVVTALIDGERRELRPDAVINCTGPGRSWEAPGNPVIVDLIHKGLAVPDPHGIGLATTADGRLLGRDQQVMDDLLVMGPPRRGTLFETTAIPELRSQALHIADHIALGG